ncbi:MAG: SH3 domain-containing protein [Rhizobiaceae bacterium]|nr:SH3 domain-containing protein [Rhizobiaceae bacterium]
MFRFLKGISAFFALSASTLSAFAYVAYTTGNVNMRSGPGTTFEVLGTLSSGTQVDVNQCQNGWCYIRVGNLKGWVSDNYVSAAGASPTVVVKPRAVVVTPPPVVVRPPAYRPPYRPRPPGPPPPPPPPQ